MSQNGGEVESVLLSNPRVKRITSELDLLRFLMYIDISEFYCQIRIDQNKYDILASDCPRHEGLLNVNMNNRANENLFRIITPGVKRFLFNHFNGLESGQIFELIEELEIIYRHNQFHIVNFSQRSINVSFKNLRGDMDVEEAKPFIEMKTKFIIELVEYLHSIAREETVKPLPNKKQRPTVTSWSDAFCRTTDYINITNIMVREGYLKDNTYLYEDVRKGNKGFIVAIIKHLWGLKYYKPELGRLSHDEIKAICMELGVIVSLSMVKKVRTEDYDLSFIPEMFEN